MECVFHDDEEDGMRACELMTNTAYWSTKRPGSDNSEMPCFVTNSTNGSVFVVFISRLSSYVAPIGDLAKYRFRKMKQGQSFTIKA